MNERMGNMPIQELLTIMDQLNESHLQLLELANRKRHVLINNEVEELNRIVLQENKLVRIIGELDTKRSDVVGQYLLKRSFRPDPRITISDLITIIFKAEERQALQAAQKKLFVTLSKLKDMNALNQQLIEQSLAFINYSYDLLFGPPEEEVVYQNPAHQVGALKRNGLFDKRA